MRRIEGSGCRFGIFVVCKRLDLVEDLEVINSSRRRGGEVGEWGLWKLGKNVF